jgi:NO-binding membrane sensor protein with MHYT domain
MDVNYDLTLVLGSFLISVAGSFMALLTAHQAIISKKESQKKLSMLSSAVALGGVGIWSMHFVGMLALDLGDIVIGYDLLITLASLIIAIAIVYMGLLFIRHGTLDLLRLSGVGFIVGSGIVAMHYSGMMAIYGPLTISWDYKIILISYLIAVLASIVALWLASNLTRLWQMAASALVMGIAVCGMHYTGMFAATFAPGPYASVFSYGFQANEFFAALILLLGAGILVTIGITSVFVNEGFRERHL